MIKMIWKSYSYAIILFIISLLIALSFYLRLNISDNDEFMTVIVNEGDTLWELAEELSPHHSLTNNEFVQWVEQNNSIYGDRIYPGDKLIIPVAVNNEVKEYASIILK